MPSRIIAVCTIMSAAFGALACSAAKVSGATETTVSVGSVSIAEGNSGATRVAYVRVTLSQAAPATLTVQAALAGGTAISGAKSPADFKPWTAAKTLTFTKGQSAKSLAVSVLPDTTEEPDQTAIITLSSPSSGLQLGTSTGAITILNDDPAGATNTVSIGSASVAEGDSGAARSVIARVTLGAAATSTVTVRATLTEGSAVSGTKSPADFKPWAAPKTLTFTRGQSAKSLTVSVLPDTTFEPNETALITLSNPSTGLNVGGATATIAIMNDDAATDCPTANFPDLSTSAGAGSGYTKPKDSVSCTSTELKVTSNGMPSYTFVAKTPNPLLAQSWSWSVPLHPTVASSSTSVSTWFGTVGFTVTGLPIYAAMEGAQPVQEQYGDPIYNGIVDTCKGHTGPAGEYHLHAMLIVSSCGFVPDTVEGYALDGFPIYAPTGCLDLDCTQVVTFKSGYTRTGNPTTNAWSAYTYQSSSDPTVLDRCNGRVGPDGTYRYYATSTFPYTFGCFKGTPTVQTGRAAAAMPAM